MQLSWDIASLENSNWDDAGKLRISDTSIEHPIIDLLFNQILVKRLESWKIECGKFQASLSVV